MAKAASIRSFRIAGRLANGFTLDLVKMGGHRRDVIDALLRTALMHANIAHVIRDAELQRRFADFDSDIPDEMRRPASIHAIAESLRVPYETARRRFGRMAGQGICRITPDGAVAPRAVTSSPMFRVLCQAQYDRLRELYVRLRAAGRLEPPAPTLTAGAAAGDGLGEAPPVRLVGRLVVEYVLRFSEPINLHIGDVLSGVVLMDIIQANTEHLPDSEAGAEIEAADGFVPDERRRPVAASTLAKRLGAPGETVRRHVLALAERDFCRKQRGGYVVPAEVLARPGFRQVLAENHANLMRLFAAVGEFGVLAAWERELAEQAA